MGNFIHRERHRRGFGVHSPFAFRMLHDVLHPRYNYYGSIRLKEIAGDAPRFRKDNRLLFYLAARLPFESCSLVSQENTLAARSVSLAAPSLPLDSYKGKCLYYRESSRYFSPLDISPGSVAVMRGCNSEIIESIIRNADTGLLFHSGRLAVYFARPEMKFVHYDVRI